MATTNQVEATTRLQIELSDQKVRQLDALLADTELPTKKELINNALTLLTWAVRETKAGRKIVSLDEETKHYKEVLLPALEHAAEQAEVLRTRR
jgi:hypothetical protein